MRAVTTGLRFPEGPIALANGDVLVVEIRRGTLTRVAPDGTTTVVADLGGGPNGAAIGPDGAVYVCNNGGFAWHDRDGGITAPGHQPPDYIGGRIQRVVLDGPDAGAVTDLYTACEGRPLRGPNDIVFDADGGFWFTDLGKKRERDQDTGALHYARLWRRPPHYSTPRHREVSRYHNRTGEIAERRHAHYPGLCSAYSDVYRPWKQGQRPSRCSDLRPDRGAPLG